MNLRIRFAACVVSAGMLSFVGPSACFAQVESINPNPLEPSGIGSGLGLHHSGTGGSGDGLRSSGPGDNPAGTMLRELNGPQYNQGRGSQRIRGEGVEGIRKAYKISAERQKLLEGAVYFGDRGAYEDAIYRPRRGSYRYETRTTRTSSYRRGS